MSLVAGALHRLSRVVRIAPERAEVEVISVGDGDWRVSLPGGSPFALLGFVSVSDGGYRVQSLDRPFAEFETATFSDAIDALRPRAAEVPTMLAGVRSAA